MGGEDGTDNRGVSGTSFSEELDEFDLAFNLATVGENGTASGDLEQGIDGTTGTQDLSQGVPEIGADGTAATVVTTPAVDAGTSPAGIDDLQKSEQRYKTLQGIHKKDKDTWAEEKARYESELAALRAAGTAGTAPAQSIDSRQAFLDSLTPEQQAQLAEYEEEFATVSRMEGLKRDKALRALKQEIETWKSEIVQQLKEQGALLIPMLDRAEENDEIAHFNYLSTTHPDYERYRDDGSILVWINGKPPYLQQSLLAIYDEGSAKDVADLITDFKKETGLLGTAASPTVIVDPEKEKLKQDLSSVTTRQGAINPTHVISEDYEGAFEEAARQSS